MLKERNWVCDIKKHIEEIEKVIQTKNQELAKALYEKISECYRDYIPCLEVGTNALFVKTNQRWNFNDGIDWVDEYDYINDLKIILNKLKNYIIK